MALRTNCTTTKKYCCRMSYRCGVTGYRLKSCWPVLPRLIESGIELRKFLYCRFLLFATSFFISCGLQTNLLLLYHARFAISWSGNILVLVDPSTFNTLWTRRILFQVGSQNQLPLPGVVPFCWALSTNQVLRNHEITGTDNPSGLAANAFSWLNVAWFLRHFWCVADFSWL